MSTPRFRTAIGVHRRVVPRPRARRARGVAAVALGAALVAQALLATAAPGYPIAPAGWPVPYLTTRYTGLSQPVFVTGDGAGRTYLVERTGRVLVIPSPGAAPEVFLDISDKTTTDSERGLLGLAFPPAYAATGHLYVSYTDLSGNSRVSRFQRDPGNGNRALKASEQNLLTIAQPFANHNGGWVGFGPDGYLYAAFGDGGSGGDPQGNAQNLATLLGKMLRLDVEAGGAGYAIPPGNPFVGLAGARPEIWSRGLRNPWRNSFDAAGTFYLADVGQNTWEEIDVEPAGAGGRNYGWNRWEANAAYPIGSTPPSKTGFTFPVAAFKHPDAESVTGGYVYAGAKHPGMAGTYLFGDFVLGWIDGMRPSGAGFTVQRLSTTGTNISSFGTNDAGDLFLCSFTNGVVYEVGDANTYSERIAGPDRFAVAATVAARAYPGWSGVTDVVIASGDDAAAADPLSASGLCWAYGAPLLLTSAARTPAQTTAALSAIRTANGPIRLHIVGGTRSVPAQRVNELIAAAGPGSSAERVLASGDRFALAAAIARRMAATRPADLPSRALIANGADPATFFDALALSAVSARTGTPVLLASANSAPGVTTTALNDLGLAERWAAGGTRTLSAATLSALGVPESRRMAGSDRYATSAVVARTALGRGWLSPASFAVAAKLPDALSGGAASFKTGGPVLATQGADLSAQPAAVLTENRTAASQVWVLGGGASISDEVRGDIARIRE